MHMTKQHFNFKEIFSFAWAKTQQHAWFLACTFMIYAIIVSAVKLTPVLEQVTTLLLALSLVSLSLIIVRNESFSFGDLFNRLKSPRLVINFFALAALYAAAVLVFILPFIAAASITAGTLLFSGTTAVTSKLMTVLFSTFLLALPGIYIAVRFKFFPYVLLENEHMSILDIIKHTYKLTCCAFWPLFGLLILISLLNLLGMLAFLLGLIVTVPVSVLALAHAYRKLEGHSH